MNESKKPKKVVRNDKGKVVPEHCDCGGKVAVFIQGEPIYKCTACGKYYGTMPFPKKGLNESLNKENKNMKKNVIKLNENALRQIVAESVKNVLKENRLSNLIGQDINNVISKQNDIVFRLESLLQSAISEAFQCGKMGNESYTECYNKKREELLGILKEFNLGNDISAYAK